MMNQTKNMINHEKMKWLMTMSNFGIAAREADHTIWALLDRRRKDPFLHWLFSSNDPFMEARSVVYLTFMNKEPNGE